jgi:phospholipid transport system substrate-binding protein
MGIPSVAGRRRVAASLVAALMLVGAPASGSVRSPTETMQLTIDAVLAVLGDPALDAAGRRSAIEKIAYERFDMVTVSRLVLARNWKRFTPEQREEYIAEFKIYLANNYGGRIERYDQEQVEITGTRNEPRGDITVHTRILGGEFANAVVDYRLRKRDGEWRIIDVIIEGISMVSNLRDQFKVVLGRGGPEHLLAKLKEKNALGPVEK